MSHLLEGLNEKQKEAVLHIDGPLLIIAGAGSGKTKALTHRIAYMIEQGIPSENILAVTFTNKASNEMKERLAMICGNDDLSVTMGTFHSVCVRILRREIHHLGFENSFTIYDSSDSLALMKSIFKERNIDEKMYNPKSILNAISNAKNELLSPSAYARHVTSEFQQFATAMYDIYQKKLFASQALDFDDLIMKSVELFKNFPDILDRYQEKYKYISVDEYQDTNNAQYELIKMIASKYGNICVIGDDWQSIYSWRGANMKNILNFEKDYKDVKVIKLEQNYRSTQMIVNAANAVIKLNKERTDKELWTNRENENKILILDNSNDRAEIENIIKIIEKDYREKSSSFSDFAVLYRTNAQSRILEEGFMRHGIPYKIVGGVKFYERKEVKDMLAYARLILNPYDNVSLLRIINTPARKIGQRTLEILQSNALNSNKSLFETLSEIDFITDVTPSARKSLINFRDIIKSLHLSNQELCASGILRHILKLTGYEKFILDGTFEGEERFRNIEELISVSHKYDGLEAGISLATFLEEVALVSDVDSLNDVDNAVTLMTLHASKGLEFNTVFLAGLEEGIFPSSRSFMDPQSLEEERRLMYVGMTRAKDKLVLSYARNRMLYGDVKNCSVSRFVDEIPEEFVEYNDISKKVVKVFSSAFEDDDVSYSDFYDETVELPSYKIGDKIRHSSWGVGKILDVQGDLLTVMFSNPLYGKKKLAGNIAPITKIDL